MEIVKEYIISGINSILELKKQYQELEDKKQKIDNEMNAVFDNLGKAEEKLKEDMKDKNEIVIQLNNDSLYKINRVEGALSIGQIIIDIKEK